MIRNSNVQLLPEAYLGIHNAKQSVRKFPDMETYVFVTVIHFQIVDINKKIFPHTIVKTVRLQFAIYHKIY